MHLNDTQTGGLTCTVEPRGGVFVGVARNEDGEVVHKTWPADSQHEATRSLIRWRKNRWARFTQAT